jgi:hypothetical protein
VPSYPIFNSSILVDYFRNHRIGLFKRKPDATQNVDYAVFEHVINQLPRQTAEELRRRRERTLVLYARPEAHAARNLYEIAELSLRELCRSGRLDERWNILGMGCLTELPPIELGRGRSLTFLRKLPEAEYVESMGRLDIGLSLMYAPHPSAVPFEFATTGALVVTNTFENRSAQFLRNISANIIPCEPSIAGVTDALHHALDRVEDFDSRIAHAYRPALSWDRCFSDDFLCSSVGRLLQ